MNENQLLIYHNDLNKLTLKGFNAREYDVFFSICAIMKDKGLNSLTLSFDKLKEISNITIANEKELVKIIKETYSKILKVSAYYETDTTFGGFMLFNQFEGNLVSRTVTISVNPKFAYMLNELTQNFTVMQLKEFTNLQSTYTKILYRQLQQYKGTGMYVIEMDRFRHLLDIPESYDMRKITQKVLTPSIRALEPIFKKLKLEKIREGRMISRLKFTFTPFQTDSIESKKIAGISFEYLREDDERIPSPLSLEMETKKKKKKKSKVSSPELKIKEPTHLTCPCCGEVLSKIKKDDSIFWGHLNWRTSNCKMTFSSEKDVVAYFEKVAKEKRKKLEQEKENQKIIEEEKEKELVMDQFQKIVDENKSIISYCKQYGSKIVIDFYNSDGVIFYDLTKNGLSLLMHDIEERKKSKSNG